MRSPLRLFSIKRHDAPSEDEWPSIVLPHVENSFDLDVDEDSESSEEQWPSISGLSLMVHL